MATTALPPLADDDLGTDVALTTDLAPVWGMVNGKTNLAMALYRRLTTPRGGLFYDPDYGYDLRDLLNANLAAADISRARGEIAAECLKDERVQAATVVLTFEPRAKSLTIAIEIESTIGPFDLVLRATQVTVDILRLAGRDVTPADVRPDATVVQVPGPQGPVGPSGGGGGGGSGLATLDQTAEKSVTSTVEEVIAQDSFDMGLLPASITMQMTAMLASASGTSTYRLRIGGTDGAADGTVVATMTRGLPAYAIALATATVVNPTGLLLVKVTAQNAVLNQAARIKDLAITMG
jgi:hypothetical protein